MSLSGYFFGTGIGADEKALPWRNRSRYSTGFVIFDSGAGARF
jgi:hypothetical protein